MKNENDDINSIKNNIQNLNIIHGCTSKGCLYVLVAVAIIAVLLWLFFGIVF